MLADNLNTLLVWLQHHPLPALVFVFLVAFSESLLIVGLIMPGAALMVGFGALIALGALPADTVLIAAIAGAIAGDGLSYWLGRHYKQALKTRWPFSAYPTLFQRGETFFHRHGGKSVMLGRFVGPLRPVVPAIAGMLAMPRSRFFVINVISACLWAPLYLLPGYLFGLSVEVASEFAGRFLLLLAALIGGLWFILFILRQLYLLLIPYGDRIFARLLIWSQAHPLAGEIPAAIVNPEHREVRGLSLLALILLLSSGLLIFLYEAIDIPLISNTSLLIQNAVRELHNPPFDKFMQALAQLAEPAPALLSAAIALFWLCLNQRCKHTLVIRHLLAAPVFPALLMLLPDSARTLFYPGTILALSIYGFLLIALARDMPRRWRMHLYAAGATLILLLMFARFYPGQISLLQLITELSLSSIWISALGIAYRRHALQLRPEQQHRLLFMLVIVLGLYPLLAPPPAMPEQDVQTAATQMNKQYWLTEGWKTLDSYRHDLRDAHRFPMNLQWADRLSTIQEQLSAQGWQTVERKPLQYFNWLKPQAPPMQLPVPAHVHHGRYETLAMVKQLDSRDALQIIRLWPTSLRVIDASGKQTPLWLGSISSLEAVTRFGLRYLHTGATVDLSIQQSGLKKYYQFALRQREQKNGGWDGRVLLVLRKL